MKDLMKYLLSLKKTVGPDFIEDLKNGIVPKDVLAVLKNIQVSDENELVAQAQAIHFTRQGAVLGEDRKLQEIFEFNAERPTTIIEAARILARESIWAQMEYMQCLVAYGEAIGEVENLKRKLHMRPRRAKRGKGKLVSRR